MHTRTLAGMNEGRDIFTLMREIELPAELYVGQGYGKVSWAVRTIWETYMGWFKARASSELYATQPVEVAADLVRLAGIDRVVELGRTSLANRDCERAMLLAEAALAHDARRRAALRLAIDANRALLERSGRSNFWETGWLETQIRTLERTLSRQRGGGVSNAARYDYRGARVRRHGRDVGHRRGGIAAAYRDAGADVTITGPVPGTADYDGDLSGYRYLRLQLTDDARHRRAGGRGPGARHPGQQRRRQFRGSERIRACRLRTRGARESHERVSMAQCCVRTAAQQARWRSERRSASHR